MPAPPWENLADFLNADEFAVEATIEIQGGDIRTVVGIFDDPYLNAQLGEYEADSSKPRLLCAEADLVGVDRRDRVEIITRDRHGNIVSTKAYDVLSGPQSDGTGMALLEMSEA